MEGYSSGGVWELLFDLLLLPGLALKRFLHITVARRTRRTPRDGRNDLVVDRHEEDHGYWKGKGIQAASSEGLETSRTEVQMLRKAAILQEYS